MQQHHIDTAKTFTDYLSVTTLVSTLFGLLPHAASLLTVVWMCIRIWETETVKKLRGIKEEVNEKGNAD